MSILVALALVPWAVPAPATAESVELAESPNGSTDVPTWEEGDSWSQGFEYQVERSEVDSILRSMKSEYESMEDLYSSGYGEDMPTVKYDFDYSLDSFYLDAAAYEAVEVAEAGVDVTIGDETYSCYRTTLESYLGIYLVLDIDLSISNYVEYDGTSIDMDIDLSALGHAYIEMDVTGDVYWVEDTLALARVVYEVASVIDMDISADMGISMQMEMPDYYYEDHSYEYSEESSEGEGVSYSEESSSGGIENLNGGIEADLLVKTTDASMSFDTAYDPPLDIFDFPINDGETWESCSEVTVESESASGSILYDVHLKPWGDLGDLMEMEEMDMSMTENLGSGFEPSSTTEDVCYWFSADLGPWDAPSGYGDLWEITGEEALYDEYYDDYWYDEWEDEFYGENFTSSGDSYSTEDTDSSALSGLGLSGFTDRTELVGVDPVSSMVEADNYYDPDQKFFVASDVGGMEELDSLDELGTLTGTDMPLDIGEDSMVSEPTTLTAVTSYRDAGRQAQRDRADAALVEMDPADEEGMDARWAYIATFVVIIVALLVIALMWSRRRKKVAGDLAGPKTGAPRAMPAPAPQPAPYAPPGQGYAPGPPPAAPPASPPQQPYPQQPYPAPASQPPQPQPWGGGLPPQAPPQPWPAQPVQQGPQQQQGWNDYY